MDDGWDAAEQAAYEAGDSYDYELAAIQAPSTCTCCEVMSTEGSSTICWQCQDEEPGSGCSVREGWERRRERTWGAS